MNPLAGDGRGGLAGCKHKWERIAADPRYPGDYYHRCSVCGLDETTDDGQGNLQRTGVPNER